MAKFQELPTETIVQVLEYLREEDGNALWNMLLVSRQLNSIATLLFYEHAFLHATPSCIPDPCESLIDSSSVHLMKSLTVLVDPAHDEDATEKLKIVRRILRKVPRLATFSLTTILEPFPGRDRSFKYPDPRMYLNIAQLITTLPATITNLEIDTGGPKRDGRVSPDAHACPIIGNLMPQLKYLRLRVGGVCLRLLRQFMGDKLASSQLRQAVIWYPCQDCIYAKKGGSIRSFPRKLEDIGGHTAFPHLEQFLIVESLQLSFFKPGTGTAYLRELVTATDMLMHFMIQDKASYTALMSCEAPRDHVSSTEKALIEDIEGPARWNSRHGRTRFPTLQTSDTTDLRVRLEAGRHLEDEIRWFESDDDT